MDREKELLEMLSMDAIDMELLRRHSRMQNGFISRRIRSMVWPKLLGINKYAIPRYSQSKDELHRDHEQVRCDVDRSIWEYYDRETRDEELIRSQRRALSDIIISILSRHPSLHYFQGYHDVVSVFLLVLENDLPLAFAVTEVVSLNFFGDCMTSDFEVVSKTMSLTLTIIEHSDTMLHQYLMLANIEPFFATSWMITWFAHDIKCLDKISRLYDALICSHPLYCLYLCASVVIGARHKIFKCECDFAALHNALIYLPKESFEIEEIIERADRLFEAVPPNSLKKLANEQVKNLIKKNKVLMFSNPRVPRLQYSDSFHLQRLRQQQSSSSAVFFRQTKPLSLSIRTLGMSPNTIAESATSSMQSPTSGLSPRTSISELSDIPEDSNLSFSSEFEDTISKGGGKKNRWAWFGGRKRQNSTDVATPPPKGFLWRSPIPMMRMRSVSESSAMLSLSDVILPPLSASSDQLETTDKGSFATQSAYEDEDKTLEGLSDYAAADAMSNQDHLRSNLQILGDAEKMEDGGQQIIDDAVHSSSSSSSPLSSLQETPSKSLEKSSEGVVSPVSEATEESSPTCTLFVIFVLKSFWKLILDIYRLIRDSVTSEGVFFTLWIFPVIIFDELMRKPTKQKSS